MTRRRALPSRLNTYLTLFKSLEISVDAGGPDKDVKAAFDSLEVHQDKSEAVLTAKVPYAFFKKVLSEPPGGTGAATQKQEPPQEEAAERPREKLQRARQSETGSADGAAPDRKLPVRFSRL